MLSGGMSTCAAQQVLPACYAQAVLQPLVAVTAAAADPEYFEYMSIWWQFIPYYLVGAAEVFTNIGTMELFYTQVSHQAMHVLPGLTHCWPAVQCQLGLEGLGTDCTAQTTLH